MDWESAFNKVDHSLGVQAFIDCGVRPSLLPLIANYFEDRSMIVQWHGVQSSSFSLPGSTPQGSSFLLEYIAISNDNADCVPQEDKFKYQDDVTLIEVVNLLSVGIASYNTRQHVSSTLPVHNQIEDSGNLQSQRYFDNISKWTKSKKMKMNEKKTKAMIFNMSKKYQFTTNLQLNNLPIEIIKEAKLLGLWMTSDMKWNLNTKKIVQGANMRMKIIQTAAKYTSSISDLKAIYFSKIRSKLEYAATVWDPFTRNEVES